MQVVNETNPDRNACCTACLKMVIRRGSCLMRQSTLASRQSWGSETSGAEKGRQNIIRSKIT